jgi:hypothetical protein
VVSKIPIVTPRANQLAKGFARCLQSCMLAGCFGQTTTDKDGRAIFYIFWSLCLLNIEWSGQGQIKGGGNTKIVSDRGINSCRQLHQEGMDGQGPHQGNPASCTICRHHMMAGPDHPRSWGWPRYHPMIGENRQLVTDEPVEIQDCKKITDHYKKNS